MENNTDYLNELTQEKIDNIELFVRSFIETKAILSHKLYDYVKHLLLNVVPMKTLSIAGENIKIDGFGLINDLRIDDDNNYIFVHFQDEITDPQYSFDILPIHIKFEIFKATQKYLSV